MSESIAVIGLGNMGGPMAANLVAAGYNVTGYDVVAAAVDAAAETGVRVARSPADAVRDADVVITMLPSGSHVIASWTELLEAVPDHTLMIDSSTIAVSDAIAAHALAAVRGVRSVDAPVSGGVVGAVAATLTFMVGAEDEDFVRAEPLLTHLGGRIVHCGGPGAGQAAKICNNLILGVSMIAVSEAFVLGERLGLTHEALFDVASNASGQCWALTTNCPVPGPVPSSPANRDYQPGFAGALMNKDLGLAMEAVAATGVSAEAGALAASLYRDFAAGEGAGLDFSAIITAIRDKSTQGA